MNATPIDPSPHGLSLVFRSVGIDSYAFAYIVSERRRMEKAVPTYRPVRLSSGIAIGQIVRRLAALDPTFTIDPKAQASFQIYERPAAETTDPSA